MRNLFSKLFLSKGVNYVADDLPLLEALDHYGFRTDPDLESLGSYVSEELVETLDFIDHHAKPVLQNWGISGDRIDYVRISPDHARALQRLQGYGVISRMQKDRGSLMYHFVSGYVISDSGIFCTLTLTAQTAYALGKYGDEALKREFLGRFYDPAEPWFGATFYSELQGGSDIGANNTTAAPAGNMYMLNGNDKYFASDAGIADAAVVTGRLSGSPPGAKGISFFFVPAYRKDGTLNYNIRRLKDKLGTTAVPTGEVEFKDSEAYLLGDHDKGIYMAMEVLVISRIDDAIAAVGIARKALWEAYLYSNVRTSFGKRLIEHPLMYRDFIEKEVELEAALALSLLSAREFDAVRQVEPPYNDQYQLARLIGNMAKSLAAETSASITRYAMEMVGGIGFFEEFPMAKFHRDSIVTSIWEGTTNIQALEILEVVSRKKGLDLLRDFLNREIGTLRETGARKRMAGEVEKAISWAVTTLAAGNPEFHAKEIMMRLAEVTSLVQMALIAETPSRLSGIYRSSSGIYYDLHFGEGKLDYGKASESRHLLEWMLRHD